MPGTVLVLMTDYVRLRHARRLLATGPVPALLALEGRAALAGAGGAHLESAGGQRIPGPALRPGTGRTGRGASRRERSHNGPTLPEDLAAEGPGWSVPDHLLPVLLKAAEKRALDLVSDWPWIALGDLAGLLGISQPRASQLVNPLAGFRTWWPVPVRPGDAWLSPTGGWPCLARRDRTSVGAARKRWSIAAL